MYIVKHLEICSRRTKPMRKEKGMNKSHTRLHLLLENSKQKHTLPQELKATFCQVAIPQYCSFHYGLKVRADPRSLSSSLQSPFLFGRNTKQQYFPLGLLSFQDDEAAWRASSSDCLPNQRGPTASEAGGQPANMAVLERSATGSSLSFTAKAFSQFL